MFPWFGLLSRIPPFLVVIYTGPVYHSRIRRQRQRSFKEKIGPLLVAQKKNRFIIKVFQGVYGMKGRLIYPNLGGVIVMLLIGCVRMTPEYKDPDLGFTAPASYQQVARKDEIAGPVQPADRGWEECGVP